MIQSLLIANRGEIACRIIRTARKMGIRTVAVYSDADTKSLHVRNADEAVHIGPSPARESYLVGEKIIDAAKATGAQAIHPGYGFLSENAAFAQSVIDAGLIWVGPDPSSITAMGLKDAAKQLMQAAGVPVTPGYLGEDQSPARLAAQADAIGYPVLIKAVAGGGGKGMRKVDAAQDFAEALAACQREATSSFGNAHVLLEKWVTNPRHIEVQIFGDTHGNVVHLFERDCSLQRRHQKVIEEAPAPGMDEATREAICAAAVRAAKAVDYVGAGTIEFIADASEGLRADRIWFMEMNTRLQVEHPVTEEITGVDLVEWQLRVASGEALPKRQDELSIDGWAMEARLYAENPATGFLPSVGKLESFEIPEDWARIEAGVAFRDTVTPFYDPMIAKIISHGEDRDDAADCLARALDEVRVWPVHTNGLFLRRLLDDTDFRAGSADTGLIERKLESLTGVPLLSSHGATQALSAILKLQDDRSFLQIDKSFETSFGFRLNRPPIDKIALFVDGEHRMVPAAGRHEHAAFAPMDDGVLVQDQGRTFFVTARYPGPAQTGLATSDGAILSPMPGRIIAVAVAAGDVVTRGQTLLTLEAMKMEHSLLAPFDGTVAGLNAAEGAQVSEGALLARIEKAQE